MLNYHLILIIWLLFWVCLIIFWNRSNSNIQILQSLKNKSINLKSFHRLWSYDDAAGLSKQYTSAALVLHQTILYAWFGRVQVVVQRCRWSFVPTWWMTDWWTDRPTAGYRVMPVPELWGDVWCWMKEWNVIWTRWSGVNLSAHNTGAGTSTLNNIKSSERTSWQNIVTDITIITKGCCLGRSWGLNWFVQNHCGWSLIDAFEWHKMVSVFSMLLWWLSTFPIHPNAISPFIERRNMED